MIISDTNEKTLFAQGLIGQGITLVCFAQYSCFIHFDNAHIRVESEVSVGDRIKSYYLFPEVEQNALNALLGKNVTDIRISSDSFTLVLNDNQIVLMTIQVDFESLTIVSDGGSVTF